MNKRPPTITSCLVGLILFSILGTFLLFHRPYPEADITAEDCARVEREFLSYEEDWHKSRLQYVFINCTNGERYYFQWTANDKLRTGVAALPAHTEISLLLYPNRHEITAFSTESETLLAFEDMLNFMQKRNTANLYLGIFMYAIALWELIVLIPLLQRKEKKQ